MTDIDYETDDAPPEDAPAKTRQSSPTLQDELREKQRARLDAAAPFAGNKRREDIRLQLEQLTWVTMDGQEIPIRWKVECESYYEVLTDAAGINEPGESESGNVLSLYIWIWLATHGFEAYYRRDPEYGIALKDNKALWLKTIFEWADEEFPMGEEHLERQAGAYRIKAIALRLCNQGRAEVLESLEPSDQEDEPGNSPAPHG